MDDLGASISNYTGVRIYSKTTDTEPVD